MRVTRRFSRAPALGLLAAMAGLAGCGAAEVRVTVPVVSEVEWIEASATLWSSEDAEFQLASALAPLLGGGHSGFALCNVELTERSSPPWAPSTRVRADVYVGAAGSPCGENHYFSILDAQAGEVGRIITADGES